MSGFRMQETDFHFDEYLRSYAMHTVGMLKVVNHTVRMRKHLNNSTIKIRYKPTFKITMYYSADNSHVKKIKGVKLKLSPFQLNI